MTIMLAMGFLLLATGEQRHGHNTRQRGEFQSHFRLHAKSRVSVLRGSVCRLRIPKDFGQQGSSKGGLAVVNRDGNAALELCGGSSLAVFEEIGVLVPIEHQRLLIFPSFEHQRLRVVVHKDRSARRLNGPWQARPCWAGHHGEEQNRQSNEGMSSRYALLHLRTARNGAFTRISGHGYY